MARTLEQFSKVQADCMRHLKLHKKPVWIVPTKHGYSLSVIKPDANNLPYGTTSNLYDEGFVIIDSVAAMPLNL